MKLADTALSQKADRIAIENIGIPSVLLMEKAAEALVKRCCKIMKKRKFKKILVLSGKGNNGGDGFAAARLLFQKGYDVNVYCPYPIKSLSADSLVFQKIAAKIGVECFSSSTMFEKKLKHCHLVIDALLGTGLQKEVRQKEADMISALNQSGKFILSADIPSGLNADTGAVMGTAVKAAETVTFGMMKMGLLLSLGPQTAGKVTVASISIPKEVYHSLNIKTHCLTKKEAKNLLPKRTFRSNKGSYGKVFSLAGSETMGGAAYLCAKAAYETGAGLVYTASVEGCLNRLQILLPEAVFLPLSSEDGKVTPKSYEDIKDRLLEASCVILGPGLGEGPLVTEFVKKVLLLVTAPIVLDADGLNALSSCPEILKERKGPTILTPHPGEMSRLTGISIPDILDNTVETATAFSKKYQVITLLKDARTVIAHPDGRIFINTTGNNAMAKGGSGDALSGIIAGLLSQKTDPFTAAYLGAYLHGLAGEIGAKKKGTYSLLARDLVKYIKNAIKKCEKA